MLIKKVISEVSQLINSVEDRSNAVEFHNSSELVLKQNGYKVKREFPISDRGDGRPGRLDLVAEKFGLTVAIELDRLKPRRKSLFKCQNCGSDSWLIFLREKPGVVISHPSQVPPEKVCLKCPKKLSERAARYGLKLCYKCRREHKTT